MALDTKGTVVVGDSEPVLRSPSLGIENCHLE